jgi:hypothetical protein
MRRRGSSAVDGGGITLSPSLEMPHSLARHDRGADVAVVVGGAPGFVGMTRAPRI